MSFPVGGKLLAKDRVGVWRRGKVIRDDGDGDERRVFVHFNKFKATQREWIGVKAGKLADLSDESRVLAEAAEETHGTTLGYHPEEDAYEAESIIRLCRGVLDRKTGLWRESKHGATEGAIIRWAGYEESDDSFEPLYNVGAPLIDEYRAAHPLPTAPEARKRKAGREPRPAKAPRPEPQPFALEACAGLSAEFKAQMAAVAESWLAADLGREIVATVRSTHEACYNKLIVSQSVPPAAYLALHTLLTQWAAEMAGTQVTELKSLKGGRDGKHVVDEFQLVGSAIDRVQARGALHARGKGHRLARREHEDQLRERGGALLPPEAEDGARAGGRAGAERETDRACAGGQACGRREQHAEGDLEIRR
jgi:hypothetical protein